VNVAQPDKLTIPVGWPDHVVFERQTTLTRVLCARQQARRALDCYYCPNNGNADDLTRCSLSGQIWMRWEIFKMGPHYDRQARDVARNPS
jgi:hypothetical protein